MFDENEFQFQKVIQIIFSRAGLDCNQYKSAYLKRRLAVRMRALRLNSYRDYGEFLRQNTQEYDLLLDRLTINVSQFFRDPLVFVQIQKLVLPRWQDKVNIRIWSAGCANGEEPYTLAILFQETLGSRRWEITATDLDPMCLARAQVGKYKETALGHVSSDRRRKYFTQEGDEWAINPELKRRIRFQRHDLTGPVLPGPFDMILCRNVLIYFNHSLQEKLFGTFRQALASKGVLVLGKTETLLGNNRQLYDPLDVRERIYEKQDGPHQTEPDGKDGKIRG